MNFVKAAFKALQDCEDVPIGYVYVCFYMICDVKMENFYQKEQLVPGGHMTETPYTITYASVVSCQTVCFVLFIAALNFLEVKCRYVMNAYVTAPIE